MKKLIILLLALLMLICLSSCKAEQSLEDETTTTQETDSVAEEKETYNSNLTVDKAETVNVKTKADGTAYKTTVEVDLKNPLDNELIKDKTNLTGIVNTESDEEYIEEDGYIYWDNNGEDIHYKGNSDEELPVSVKITYYLDGKEIEPSKLAHASGHVKIHFEYINNTNVSSKVNGVNYNVKIPFICMTMLYLPNDNFYNIVADDCQMMDSDGSTLIVGMGFPGLEESLKLNNSDLTKDINLKDYFEIEADVSDFELDYTATIVSNGLLEDLEDSDFKDIDDMLNDVDDIDDQKADIEDSKDELSDASDEFSAMVDKLGAYVTTLNAEANTMYANFEEIIPLLTSKMTELNEIIDSTHTKNAQVDPTTGNYSFNLISDTDYETKKNVEIQYYSEHINDSSIAIKEAATSALKIANYFYASEELIAYSNAFASSFNASSVKASINDAFDDLIDVLDEFEDNIDELTENIDSGLKEIVNRLKATRNVDNEYDNFSGLVEGKQGSVIFIIQSDEIK